MYSVEGKNNTQIQRIVRDPGSGSCTLAKLVDYRSTRSGRGINFSHSLIFEYLLPTLFTLIIHHIPLFHCFLCFSMINRSHKRNCHQNHRNKTFFKNEPETCECSRMVNIFVMRFCSLQRANHLFAPTCVLPSPIYVLYFKHGDFAKGRNFLKFMFEERCCESAREYGCKSQGI